MTESHVEYRSVALPARALLVTAGLDRNAQVNPSHPDTARIVVRAETPVRLDPRLFGAAAASPG